MDVYYNRAREWSRSARLFATFVERKADLDNDVAKATSKAVRQALDGLDEQKLLSAGTLSTSVLAILREQDSVAARQLEVANKIRAEVLQPLVYACRSPAAPSTPVTLASDARPIPPRRRTEPGTSGRNTTGRASACSPSTKRRSASTSITRLSSRASRPATWRRARSVWRICGGDPQQRRDRRRSELCGFGWFGRGPP